MIESTVRRAVVLGGSTGIGRGIADAWADCGARVVVCSRTPPTGARADRLDWEQIDLTDADASRHTLTTLAKDRVDAVCYSSIFYGNGRAAFEAVEEREWRRQLEVNVSGLWLTLDAMLPALRAAAPALFLGVSSEVVFNAGPNRSGYTATKAAAKGLLDSVAREVDPAQVAIVQTLPAGMVDTPGIRRRRPPNFDYSSYMVPADFGPLARQLLEGGGHEAHGESLVVDGGGDWWSAYDRLPVSQSRPLR